MTRVRKRLHLDFHNHPTVRGIGSELTPDSFQQGIEQLGIDSVVLFAKCHHGMSYYNTSIGVPHPGMVRDMLEAQCEACDKAGVGYHLYFSVLRDNWAYDAHPEWRWLDGNGNPSSPAGEWRIVCLNSGYYRDYLKPHIMESLDRFPNAEGIWLDIIRTKGTSCFCPRCVEDAAGLGLSPQEFDERMRLEVFRDLRAALEARGKEMTLNTFVFFGNQEWRPLSPIEIESILAHVGPFYFPLFSRYLNRYPTERYGITHSFYQNWREFGTVKNHVQMNYEVCQMAFSGFGVSLGDELEPDGTFESRRFGVLRGGYRLADRLNELCDHGGSPVREVAVIAADSSAAQEDGQPVSKGRDSFVRGMLKLLTESNFQTAIIDLEEDFSPYKCLMAQASQLESSEVRARIDSFIEQGGKVFVLGTAGSGCLDWLGLKRTGVGNAEYQFLEQKSGRRQLVKSKMEMLEVTGDLEVIGHGYLPFGDSELGSRESSCIRPADPDTKSPTVFVAKNGRLVYCLPDIASDYFDRGDWFHQLAFGRLWMAIDAPPFVCGNIPGSAEVWLYETEEGYELRVLDCSLKRENVIFAQQTEYELERRYDFFMRTPRRITGVFDKDTGQAISVTEEEGADRFEVKSSKPYLVISLLTG